jgi:3-dehydroquinate dehydratase-1
MRIGTVELGKKPRTVLVLSSPERVREDLELARIFRIDLVEARMDLLKDKKVLDIVSDYGFYSILTVRPTWEGGKFNGTEEERLEVFKSCVKHPGVGAVDVEVRAEISQEVKKLCKSCSKVLIASYHDFERTPPDEEIEEIFEKCAELGDIVKIALTPSSYEDVRRFCCLMAKKKKPKVFMAMGTYGKITRIAGFVFSSLLTYTFFGKAVAPGQIDAEKTINLLKEFYGESVDCG